MKKTSQLPSHLQKSNIQWAIILGAVMFFTGLIVTGFIGAFTWWTALLCVIGIMLAGLLFLPKISRNIKSYLDVYLYTIIVLLSVGFVYAIIIRHPISLDATADKLNSLHPITKDFLKRLDRDITITAFVSENERNETERLLNEFSRNAHQISTRVLNPIHDYTISQQYGDVAHGDIFIETMTSDTKSKSRLVSINKTSEEAITNGIIQLLRGKDITLYFLSGHGELSIESSRNYAAITGARSDSNDLEWIKKQLERNRITAKSLNITQRGKIPSDASAIICIGAKQDFSGSECVALRNYIENGGKVLFGIAPELPQITPSLDNLRGLLLEYGIEMPPSIIFNIDQDSKNSGGSNRVVVGANKPHRINQLDPNDPLVFSFARVIQEANQHIPDLLVENVLQTVSKCVAVPSSEYAQSIIERKKPEFIVESDSVRPLPVAQAVTVYAQGRSEDDASKLVVVGCSDFLSTENITQSAYLFFMNAINWLTSDTELITVPATEIENTPLQLSKGEKQFLFILMVILIPTLIGLLGLAYLISRRELS
ncbi:MAG: GldG family protein [Candidatus Sumerlaeales bacterium]|nr:GldG family protein [Candidatus Sumerlaeales bacterium]